MNQRDFERYKTELDWSFPQSVQQNAVEQLKNMKEEHVLSLTENLNKSQWENVATVLQEIGYPRNKQAIPWLIELLQDLNWPGANHAVQILSSMNHEELLPYIEEAVQKAKSEEDGMWLAGIKRVIEASGIAKNEFTNRSLFESIIEMADF